MIRICEKVELSHLSCPDYSLLNVAHFLTCHWTAGWMIYTQTFRSQYGSTYTNRGNDCQYNDSFSSLCPTLICTRPVTWHVWHFWWSVLTPASYIHISLGRLITTPMTSWQTTHALLFFVNRSHVTHIYDGYIRMWPDDKTSTSDLIIQTAE